jgi:hypothetical protein
MNACRPLDLSNDNDNIRGLRTASKFIAKAML